MTEFGDKVVGFSIIDGDELIDNRGHLFFSIDDAFADNYAGLCGVYATGVYMVLCRHSNKERRCYPGVDRIGKMLGISRDKVIDGIRVLEGMRIIGVKRIPGGKNSYKLRPVSEWKKIATKEQKQRKKLSLIDKYGGGQVKGLRIGNVGVVVPSDYDTTAR